eukprot:16144-Heterococcus_DN1.PRE.3
MLILHSKPCWAIHRMHRHSSYVYSTPHSGTMVIPRLIQHSRAVLYWQQAYSADNTHNSNH